MCGRFTIYSRPEDYLASFNASVVDTCKIPENYNAYPSQRLPVVIADEDDQIKCELYQWGLIPAWAKDTSIGFKLSNARSETAAEKPSFKHAFRQRRCMVPVDGWYEWLRDGNNKQPYYHRRKDRHIIWLAGLWENWLSKETGENIRSFTILTQEATGKAEKIHNRMPVFINPDDAQIWLDKKQNNIETISSLMVYDLDDALEIYPVSKDMNSPKFNCESCIVPVQSNA